jgi:hypothetical protein
MIRDYITHDDNTEDGDFIYTRHVICDTIAEAREMNKDLKQLVSRSSGHTLYHDIAWMGKGGKLVWTDTYVVDAAEVWIERNNDAAASMRDMAFREEW